MFQLESTRLRLMPLTTAQLQLHAADYDALQRSLGLVPRQMQMEEYFQNEFDDALANYWLPETAANASRYEWFTNWLIVYKKDNCVAGGIGVAGLPNDRGETEIGYGIDCAYRGKGIATEALECLSAWVFKHPAAVALIAHTPVALTNSQRVLQKAGFEQISEKEGLILWRKLNAN
ncbi:GNAT family N-acetyltransferase [Runella slithyformis]|uniref:GCN5-related N-acetyltransferase n=1 Tax=Runella slithyformis (strain ATCC 29530 / DSM 19594 / LMG 11500 / NCIMB 11436 / LSU 4) TaxID=761193 RepID=A0A7U4E739_RUNSL|nr:GNAT family N-acetyltransferase [Runella slithyformis]AEI49974.1 GCN5-related N-acetyltransferase [Runella slithyformis DSM 19594]